jgi:hypothetical protein
MALSETFSTYNNFNATVIFCHFVYPNLYVFVRCIVTFLPSQNDSQIHVNLDTRNEKIFSRQNSFFQNTKFWREKIYFAKE